MKIKDGDIVFAINRIATTLGSCEAGDSFEVIRVTKTHVIGRGIIAPISEVCLHPVDADAFKAMSRIRNEIGL